MKVTGRYAVLAAAVAALAVSSVVAAQETTSSSASSAAPMHRHWHGRRGSMLVMTLLRATRQLNLSTDQQQTIKSLLSQARSQYVRGGSGPDITVLGNPGHENYASAVQTLQSNAATRIQRESELASSIYNVLTTEQKQQLPTVLANLKAQAQARRAAWQAQHTAGASGTSN
ncbi:MAG TPA: hypothetical protein VMD49_07435 [Steroidobacteraceae bacterium]|nr:hypothetical protein [Steroidobacteraceae bacterium]